MLKANNVSFLYPGSSRKAVENLSCMIQPGEIVALMGASGSGKTTLARLLAGSLQPASGTISADGVLNEAGTGRSVFRRKVGILLSEPDYQLIGESVEEELAFGLVNANLPASLIEERVAEALSDSGMGDYAAYPPRFLSGGQKQKLLLLAFSLLEPAYLILDEPFQMLDAPSRKLAGGFMLHLARQKGQGILFCTHDSEEALGLADRILFLQGGKLVLSLDVGDIYGRSAELQAMGFPLPETLRLFLLLEKRGLKQAGSVMEPQSLAEVIWHCWFEE